MSLAAFAVLLGLKRAYDAQSFIDPRHPHPEQGASEDEEKHAMNQEEPQPELERAAPSSYAGDLEAGWRASMENRLDGLTNMVGRQGFELHSMGRFLKKMGKHFGISSSKGMNRILQTNPTSTARYMPQPDEEDDESPPPAGDDGAGAGTTSGGAEEDMDAIWDTQPSS